MSKSSRSSTTNSTSTKPSSTRTSAISSSTSPSFQSLIPRLRWPSLSGSPSTPSRKDQASTASQSSLPLFPDFPSPPSFVPSPTRPPPPPPLSVSFRTLGGDGIRDNHTFTDHPQALSPFPASPPPSIPLPPTPSSSYRSSTPSGSKSNTVNSPTSSTPVQTMPTLIRPRQRTTSTSSVETIRPSRAVVMLDELTRTYQDMDMGSEIDSVAGSSSDLVEGPNSRSATPVGARKSPAPTAKVVRQPTTTVTTSAKTASARKSSNRISKHSSTKLQERKGKSTFISSSSSSSSSSRISSPSLTFPPNISTPTPSPSSSTPTLHSSAQAKLESGSSSSSMVTNPTPTPPGPPYPPRKLSPTLGALSLRPTPPDSLRPGLLSGESTSVNVDILPPNPPEIHPSPEENPFPSRSVTGSRNVGRTTDSNDPDQRQDEGSFHSPFAFEGPPFDYQEYGDFSDAYSGSLDQQQESGGGSGDGLTVRIFDEEQSADPFSSGIAPPEIVVAGVGVEEWEKEQEQAILRAPIALQSLQLQPPFSDESSASSDDPFEFDARRRPWIPTRTSPNGVARQTKVHRKVQADDLKLEVVFFRSRHQVFWDMDDQDYLICPAQIHVLLKHPLQWNQHNGDISMPEIYALDLECCNDAVPSLLAKRDPDVNFSVRYTGSRAESESRRSRKKKSTRRPGSTPPSMVPKRGICIDFDWEKLYSPSGSWEDSGSYSSDGRFMKGWFTDIWIPIPTRLFAKKETRSFTISSEIWFHRDANAVHGNGRGSRGKKRIDEEELEPDGVFGSETIMTVSHLWKEREMLKAW